MRDASSRVAAVRSDIHPGEIGDEPLIAKRIDIEDQALLQLSRVIAKSFGAEIEAEFQRHIEARQAMDRVEFGPRQIVDSIAAFLDDAIELVYPGLAAVVQLAGRSRAKSAAEHREDEGVEHRCIGAVERAVDEHIIRRAYARRQRAWLAITFSTISRIFSARAGVCRWAGFSTYCPVAWLRPSFSAECRAIFCDACSDMSLILCFAVAHARARLPIGYGWSWRSRQICAIDERGRGIRESAKLTHTRDPAHLNTRKM